MPHDGTGDGCRRGCGDGDAAAAAAAVARSPPCCCSLDGLAEAEWWRQREACNPYRNPSSPLARLRLRGTSPRAAA